MEVTVQQIHFTEICKNPRQEAIYGKLEEDKDLTESIREFGVQEPAIVTKNAMGGYRIVSGHRRWMSARALEIHLPCIVREFESEEAELLVLIESNRQRKKKPSQEWAEMDTSSKALKQAAEARRRAGVTTFVPDGDEGPQGRSDELLAARFGVSRKRVNQLQKVFSNDLQLGVANDLVARGLDEVNRRALLDRWGQIREEVDTGAVSLTKAEAEISNAIQLAEEQLPGAPKKRQAPAKGRPAAPSLPEFGFRQFQEGEDLSDEAMIHIGGQVVNCGFTTSDAEQHTAQPAVQVGDRVMVFDWATLVRSFVEPQLTKLPKPAIAEA